jgi:hypothetical protein
MLSSFTSRFAATSSFSSFVSRVYSARSFFTPVRLSTLATSFLHLGTGKRNGYGVGKGHIPLVSAITRPTLRVENETEIYWKATSREEAAARVMTFA